MNNITLEKDWVAGFIDGDGSFSIEKISSNYRPILSVAQNDVKLLHKLKQYFGCGEVTQKSANSWHYRCRSAENFQRFIIPKLGDNPFQTKNQLKYQLLRDEALPLMISPNCLSLSPSPLSLSFSFGEGEKGEEERERKEREERKERRDQLEQLHKSMKLLSEDRDYVNPNLPITLEWFRGFFEAEGNLYYKCRSKSGKVDIRISLKVTQKNVNLLEKINKFFPFGAVQIERKESCIYKFNVEGVKNVQKASYILTSPFKGDNNIKRCRFLSFLRIVSKGEHNTEQGLARCDKLVSWSRLKRKNTSKN